MRGSLLVFLGLFGAGCGAEPRLAPAPAAGSIWPVAWAGSFGTGSSVSPDGSLAVVMTGSPQGAFAPVLYRLEPPGPVATLEELFGGRVQVAKFSSDGKRLAGLIDRRPELRNSYDFDCGVIDLETRASRRFRVSKSGDGVEVFLGGTWFAGSWLAATSGGRLKRFSAETGAEAPIVELPESEVIESLSPALPLLVSMYEQRRRVFRIEGNEAREVGGSIECLSSTDLRWSEHEAMFAMRCDGDLLVWRPQGETRVPLGEKGGDQKVLRFGNRGRVVALGGTGEPRAFDTTNGKAVPFTSFVPDDPGFAVTGWSQRLWRDDKQRQERSPLPGLPELFTIRNAEWKGEGRVVLTVGERDVSDTTGMRKVELEVETARVAKSERFDPSQETPDEGDETLDSRSEWAQQAARELQGAETDDNGDLVAEITAKGRVVASGPLVAEERGHVAIRRPGGEVELWTDDGRRVGKLPKDTKRIPFLSPSGAIGIEPRGAGMDRLVRTKTGEVLTLLVVRQGDKTLGLVTAASGWFAGDPEAFTWLRFARGHDPFDAVPLTGRDVRAQWERPKALRDFLRGRPVALERPEVPRRAR